MVTKITVERTQEDGKVIVTKYQGDAFMVAVCQGDGVATESSINGPTDGVEILTGAVAAVAGISKNNGVKLRDIVEMVAEGTSHGIKIAIGHECTNCGKCGKKVN